jgi:hypothetical protein
MKFLHASLKTLLILKASNFCSGFPLLLLVKFFSIVHSYILSRLSEQCLRIKGGFRNNILKAQAAIRKPLSEKDYWKKFHN